MFSQTAEYALRAMVFLADNTDKPYVAQDIAEATKVPAGYLSKVLQSLVRTGLLNSQRGLGGGFALTKPKEQITIYEIIHSVVPIQRITTCPLGLVEHGSNLCPLHRQMDDAMALVEQNFRQKTLGQILEIPTASRPLCPFPRVPAK